MTFFFDFKIIPPDNLSLGHSFGNHRKNIFRSHIETSQIVDSTSNYTAVQNVDGIFKVRK